MNKSLYYWYDSSDYSTSGELGVDLEELIDEFSHLEYATLAIINYDEDEIKNDWQKVLDSSPDNPYHIGDCMQIWVDKASSSLPKHVYTVSMGCGVSKVFSEYRDAVHYAMDDVVGNNTNLLLVDIYKEPEDGYALIKYKNIALNSCCENDAWWNDAWWNDEPHKEIIEEITIEQWEVS